MRQYILFTLFTLFAFAVNAQIVVTNATFPEVGDTLVTATDNLPTGLDIGSSGADKVWDFSGLTAPFSQETIYQDASEGSGAAEVPEAELFVDFGNAVESYISVTDEVFELVAVRGNDPLSFGINALLKFSPPIVERRAPMSFGDVNTTESNASVPFGSDIVPDTLLDQLPLVPDSIRIRINEERTDIVDAYGTMTIPGGTFDVLREKRTAIRSTRVDALVPFFGWQDVTDIIIDLIGVDVGLGDIETTTYLFFNDESKEIIAEATVNDADEIVQVTYKFIDVVNNINPILVARPGVYAYPNPAITDARFEFANLNAGNYKLKIYNILGVAIWENDYYINGTRVERVDLNHFRKGTYLYSLEDESGKTLVTKRLMILRP